MNHLDLTSPDWMLARLAVIALDVAAVALIVWLSSRMTAWRRRWLRANPRSAKPRRVSGQRASMPRATVTRLSKATAAHPSLH